jgi:hypothetical protein
MKSTHAKSSCLLLNRILAKGLLFPARAPHAHKPCRHGGTSTSTSTGTGTGTSTSIGTSRCAGRNAEKTDRHRGQRAKRGQTETLMRLEEGGLLKAKS